jgi:cellulose synthase operon protein C
MEDQVMAHVGDRSTRLERVIPYRIAVPALMACAVWSSASVGQVDFRAPTTRTTTKVYFDASHKADADLRSGDNHAKSGNYAEAIEIYQRVIQQFGDKVVEVPGNPVAAADEEDSRLSVNARRECQRRIAALPPEARAIYRGRVDPQAERWFRQGRDARDRAMLRRVVDQAFCSSWGDDALELLGDLAFQDGQFVEALVSYTQLVPDRPSGGLGLVHPDPSVDLAKVEAKKMLCRAAIGDHPPTPAELAAFATAHPAAPGPFAGRKGLLADALAEALLEDDLAPPPQSDARWATFAGSPTRTRIASGPVDVGSLQWRAELEPLSPTRGTPPYRRMGGMGMGATAPIAPDRLLGYHPIVVGDQVIVANERQVIAYNLNSRPGDQAGVSSTPVEVAWKTREDLIGAPMPIRGNSGLPRYTLTAFGDRIYARLGQPPSSTPPMTRMGIGTTYNSPSFIVALDRSAQGKLLWRREAMEIALPKRQANGGAGSRNAVFEGTPVADAHNVYVAITDRIEMTAAYVACLDAETGATRWVRYICEANANIDPFLGGGFEISHRLLTLDGPALYYQTNLGVLASLEAENGSVRWLATYPWQRRGGINPSRERDLNPAIVHDGLVIIAPEDAPAIYAFDATTGRLAWKTEQVADQAKLTHLLGVAKGYLIASGDQVLWYDIKNGRLAHTWPDNAQAVQGFGRGVLAGDRVYWPTKSEIHILDQSSGLIADPPIKLHDTFQCEGGNLAIGDGYLIVAQGSALVVFCQNSRLIDRYRDEIARAPDQAINYYRLAQAAEAIGRDEVALTSLVAALPHARASESIDGSPLGEAILDHQRVLLMKLGQKAKVAKDWVQAAQRFGAAAEAARNDRDRFAARLELSEVQFDRGEAREAVATLQALLADERMRALTVDAADGHRSIRADLLVADRLAAVLRDKGRGLYADFERAASELLARGKAEKDARLLEDVGRSYPVALAVPEAWRSLGELYEETHHPSDAARTYKKLLARATDDSTRAQALLGLARAYEAQKLWVLARDAYFQAKKRFGNEPIAAPGGPREVALLVTDRLAREPFDRMLGDRGEPSVPVPLRRRWDRSLSEAARPLGADGVPPSAEAGRVFLVQGREIRPVDPATGESVWSRDLEGEPIWVGYLADRIIAATKTRLFALSLDKGAVEWQYDLGTDRKVGNDPFAKEPLLEPGRDAVPLLLKDFRIVGNRVFCLRGDQALLAFDGDTGQLDWSYAPSTGRINPHLLVGQRRIVLQVLKPNVIQVLNTADGSRRSEFPQPEEEGWPRDPLAIDDEHVALVADRLTVSLFDTTRGINAWVFRETKELPSHGPPRLFGDAERLLVLHHGQNLIRLDVATGNKLWADWRLLGTEDLSERPEAIALGDDRVYVASGSTSAAASGSTLSAYAIADGSTLWKKMLNGQATAWDLTLTERSVAAYPAPSKVRDSPLGVLPLVFHRKSDGEPIQRVLIQTSVTDLAIRFTPKGALVATQGGLWALGDRQVMDGSRGPR